MAVAAMALGMAFAAAPAAAADCSLDPADGTALSDAGVRLAFKPEAGEIRQGQGFALLIRLCPADARLLRVDATMPEHRHGMNYRPSLQALGDGRWRADGLLWHMAGRWELRFDLAPSASPGQTPTSLRHSLMLR